MAGFKDEREFKKVFEQIFALMNDHETVGKGLFDARAPHRFEITDFNLEFNVTYASDAEAKAGKYLRWVWGSPDWEPLITMRMASDVANRFFQGKENVAMAVMMGRVKLKGPMSTIIQLAPVTAPIQPVYRRWLEDHGYDHLIA
jgi:hypothetical protein